MASTNTGVTGAGHVVGGVGTKTVCDRSSGAAAGQDVFHYHLHLIPRYDDDAVQPGWGAAPWRRPEVSEGALDAIAALVAEKLR